MNTLLCKLIKFIRDSIDNILYHMFFFAAKKSLTTITCISLSWKYSYTEFKLWGRHELFKSLADPGGAHPARAPPNGRGPMIFLCPKRYFFSIFFRSLRSRYILSLILIEIGPKHAVIGLHHCVVIFFWSSGTIDCLFTFENGVPLMR